MAAAITKENDLPQGSDRPGGLEPPVQVEGLRRQALGDLLEEPEFVRFGGAVLGSQCGPAVL